MITVAAAEKLIQAQHLSLTEERLPIGDAWGRVLAESIVADRDVPPYHRVAMDGIAIRFEDYAQGCRQFQIQGTVGAGAPDPGNLPPRACWEIMTGAALPEAADTVVPYEHIEIQGDVAILKDWPVKAQQNVHTKGKDSRQGALLMAPGRRIGAIESSVAASVGHAFLLVKSLPRVALFSTGNELVEVEQTPLPFQIRRSNTYLGQAFLHPLGIQPACLHLPDDLTVVKTRLEEALEAYDVLVLSGGVSAGKYDYLPEALKALGVHCLFHKVQQRPGKPFWFGVLPNKCVVFALPGNPVSTAVCWLRYVLPWLRSAMGWLESGPEWAQLAEPIAFEPSVQLFLQVRLEAAGAGQLLAHPVRHHGSGDYASLLHADAFMELPAEKNSFEPGEMYPFWRFRF